MWQRVQTLYLAVSTILIAVLFFSVKASVVGGDGEVVETYRYTAYIPYLILLVIIAALDVLALTTFKFRVFQMRTAVLSSLITLALQVWLAVDFFTNRSAMVFSFTSVFPIVSIILNVMAARGILADEMLVQSAYHLRSSKRK